MFPGGDITGQNGRGLVFRTGTLQARTAEAWCSRTGTLQDRTAEAWCSRKGTLQAGAAEAWCSRTGTLQAQIPSTASDGLAPSAFSRILHRQCGVVLSAPSYFSQWSSSSFVVDGVSYSCAEQFMMAAKARLFKEHRAVELIMLSLIHI